MRNRQSMSNMIVRLSAHSLSHCRRASSSMVLPLRLNCRHWRSVRSCHHQFAIEWCYQRAQFAVPFAATRDRWLWIFQIQKFLLDRVCDIYIYIYYHAYLSTVQLGSREFSSHQIILTPSHTYLVLDFTSAAAVRVETGIMMFIWWGTKFA